MDSAKLEILIGIVVPVKERIRMGSSDLWIVSTMKYNRIRSG
jgi:hypothetical protein